MYLYSIYICVLFLVSIHEVSGPGVVDSIVDLGSIPAAHQKSWFYTITLHLLGDGKPASGIMATHTSILSRPQPVG